MLKKIKYLRINLTKEVKDPIMISTKQRRKDLKKILEFGKAPMFMDHQTKYHRKCLYYQKQSTDSIQSQ
jgi:hypothetical protein